MKMLATSAVYADEILIGNLTPIDEKFKSEAITAALPLNAPGVYAVVAPALCAGRVGTRPTTRCRIVSTRPTACWSATA